MLLKKSRQGDVIKITEEALVIGLTITAMGGNVALSLADYAEGLAETLSVSRAPLQACHIPELLAADCCPLFSSRGARSALARAE